MQDPYLLDPAHIDAKPMVLEGIFRPGDLERLEDSLANGEGELRYTVTATLDRERRKVLSCIIEGFVFLTCQGSLEVFQHDVAIDDRLILVDEESQLPPIHAESETEDYLVADEPLDIRDLVEDAVLLSLPMMPRKPGFDADQEAAGEPAAKQSPFAALAELKKSQ